MWTSSGKKIVTMVRLISNYNLFCYTGRNDALDKKADFDEYTIYDQGQLNEYGLLKDAAKKKLEGGAGLDSKADFDEYTIYDQGMLVHSMLVRLREKRNITMYQLSLTGYDACGSPMLTFSDSAV